MALPAPPAADAKKQLCTFCLGDLYFGVDVLQVQEVLRFQEMTPVPLAPPEIRGLINLRGQVVTAVDLRLRLGLAERPLDGRPPAERPPEERPMNVIVRAGDDTLSLLVDEIGDVVEPVADALEPPPETLAGRVRDVVDGVYKLDGRLLLEMDADRTLNLPPRA